jgi:hypothetical protein
MIIKGKSRGRPASLAAHLTSAKNERVELAEVRGLLAGDLLGALREMEVTASGSKCSKFMYHANIDPDARYAMTPEQWGEAVDALEKNLGLTGQPRVVVIHEKEGREHRHIVWSRIKPETMTAVSDSHNYRKHEEVSRDLERRFGHDRVQGAHAEREDKPRPDRTPDRADIQQQERAGKSGREAVKAVKDVKAEVTALWHETKTGAEFAAGLAERGYILAQGEKRDFVIVDAVGAVHSLARRIDGVKTAAVRERMADVDRANLPTVEAAKAQQIERQAATAAKDEIRMDERPITTTPEPTLAPTAARPATPDSAAEKIDTETARQQAQRQGDLLAEIEQQGKQAEAVRLQGDLLDRMERQEKARVAFIEEQADIAAKARAAAPSPSQVETGPDQNGDITDARSRYAQAVGKDYQVENPYGSLARAAMTEYGRFAQQQEALGKQIASAKTPDERRSLELRKEIEGCEYMAITSKRLAGMSRVVTGDMNSEQSQRDEAAAKFYQSRSAELRAERAGLEKERTTGRQETGAQKATEPKAENAAAPSPAATPALVGEKQPRQQAQAAPEVGREIAYGQPLENPGLTPARAPTTWHRTGTAAAEQGAKVPEPTKPPIRATTTAQEEQRAAPPRAGNPPKAVEQQAINQETANRNQQQQREEAKKTDAFLQERRSGPTAADPSRKETAAERSKRFKEMMAEAKRENAKEQGRGQGIDRGGGGRGDGGNSR